MDILDFLNSAYGKMVVGAGAIGLIVLVVALLGIGRLIYFALFPAKRTWRTKSFEKEAEENRSEPVTDPESIGSISTRLGEDIRDVWMMGYSDDQIDGVLTGKYTLMEMYKMEPEGNTRSPKGKEILGNQERLAK
jgi:hypothetical protein